MPPKTEYDPARALSAHRAQERSAWDRYAAAALVGAVGEASIQDAAYLAAQQADALLAERRRRFTGPRPAQTGGEEATQ
jgi:hypothetical protein